MKKNRYILSILVILAISFSIFSYYNYSRPVLKVGDKQVTKKEFQMHYETYLNANNKIQSQKLSEKEIKEKILNSLSNELLLYVNAEEKFSKEDAVGMLNKMKETMGEKEYQSYLEKSKITEDFVLESIMISETAKNEKNRILNETEIKTEEAKKFYEENKSDFKRETFEVYQIFIPNDSKEDKDIILKEALEGKNFDELCKKYSKDQITFEKGGYIGIINEETGYPEIYKALKEHKADKIEFIYPELIKTPYGFHIVKAIKIDGSNFNDVEKDVFKEMENKKLDEYIKLLRDITKIKVNLRY